MTAWLNSAIRLVVIVGGCFGLSLCTNPAYALPVQPHVGLALVGYENTGTQSAPNAVFLCAESFSVHPSMVKLKGTRSRVPVSCITGRPTLSALPPYLVVSGKASELNTGVSHD